MKTYRPFLSVLSFCFLLSGAASASTLATVSGDGGAFDAIGELQPNGILVVGQRLDCTPCSMAAPDAGKKPVDAFIKGGASFLGALANMEAKAHAEPGHLSVSIQAGGSAEKDKQKGAVNSVQATAEWLSRVRFFTSSLPEGAKVITHPLLSLEGDFSGSATGPNSSFAAALKVQDLSGFPGLPPAPYQPGEYWGFLSQLGGGTESRGDVPGAVRLTREFRNGSFANLGFRFQLVGSAVSDDVHTDVPSSTKGTAVVIADASRSLRWAGIESVTDEDGNPITDWSIISDDGFDYSKPFGVPEPSSILLLVTAFSPGLALRRATPRRAPPMASSVV